ncbi:carboxypeptidase regulatory-like domain-containing protein [Variovorax sp. N23]|uniref:carboxypeptidase regulatory-like domain-containing protein n=1 Tax=Variovorax sp. N23 TaxID=2980555 RepID=UPI0021C83A0E|nr:carboxypeptidase regulatory-like domain-containing protein [Variovorax sp. N23]MCU4121923.1 carboxypeptidase regulatory-like domain-containing protein [Variovorax sp. N23]
MNKKTRAGLAAAILLSLAACGGGGNSGSASGTGTGTTPPVTEPVATQATLSGVAATGAAFAGATVTVTDQTGVTVCTTQTDDKGAYNCTLPLGTKAPLVIKASRDELSFYSTTASAGSGTANVTPLTTIVVSQLSPDGNPASLAGAITTRPESVTATTIQAQVSELLTALQPLLSALNVTIDPMSGVFVADGTGQDKVLDAISVSVRPDGTAANIEITVKAQPATADAAPMSISFRSDATAVPTLPAVTAAQLDAIPSPAMVAGLFERMTACYALPASQRVTNGNDNGAVIGTAANVVAPVCRGMFLNDDPATFQNNGNNVGRDANNRGAYASLFRSGATGLKWERGNFEFLRTNGDVVMSYRWVDSTGNAENDTLIARNVNGTLKLVGNGNTYSASVRPFSEDRDLINTPAFSSFTTGYNISIDNRLVGGASVFSKVVVTTPFGSQLTYVPTGGLSYLVAQNNGTATGSSVYRLAAAYKSSSTTGNPADKESFFTASPQYDEAGLRALQDQSVWKLEFFHVDTQVPNVVQSYRTLSRAQSIAEIQQLVFVDMTPTLRAELIAETGASNSGNLVFGALDPAEPNIIDFSAAGNTAGWVVPGGALAPTSLSAYGRAPAVGNAQGTRYNDSTGVSITARKAKLYCSTQGASDTHCDATSPTQYAQGTTMNMFELWARNTRQVEVSKKFATYKLQ